MVEEPLATMCSCMSSVLCSSTPCLCACQALSTAEGGQALGVELGTMGITN